MSGSPPTLLLGSGLSLWKPTGLPTGQDFTNGVVAVVFESFSADPADKACLDGLLASLPFEMLLERCPNPTAIREIITEVYACSEPNRVHKAIAAMAADGCIHSIVTTNFDLALDAALNDVGWPLIKIVLDSPLESSDRIYLKIHGSSDQADSLVFSTSLESRLPPWKRRILSNCVHERTLVILGYSGLDFDLCPEISLLKPRVILWNFLKESDAVKPGPLYFSRHAKPLVPLLGDMARLLQLFGYPVAPLERSNSAIDIAQLIRERFTAAELLLWRASLLNTMGFSRLVMETLRQLNTSSYLDWETEHAQALFHNGSYRSSGREFLRLSNRCPAPHRRILRLLDASDAFRCYGNWLLSYLCVRRAAKVFAATDGRNDWIRARIAMKKLLLLQDVARVLPFAAIIVKTLGKRLVALGADAAIQSGEWLAYQQFMLISERWSIPKRNFTLSGNYAPPPSKDGYRHLGYKVGELLSLIDRSRIHAASVTECQFLEALREAIRLGSYPTAWKIAARMRVCFPGRSETYAPVHRRYLSKCEYSALLRRRYRVVR